MWGKQDGFEGAPKWLTPSFEFNASSNVVDVDNNKFLITSHGLVTDTAVIYLTSSEASNAVLPLVDGQTYYVIRINENEFSVSETKGGAAVDITQKGTGTKDKFQVFPENLLFVDLEASQDPANKAIGIDTPGWWVYDTYVDSDGDTRHRTECLVAFGKGD